MGGQAEAEEADPAQMVLRLTHSAGSDSYVNEAALILQERLEQISGGRCTVEIYPGNAIGSLESSMNSFGNGVVDLRIGAAGSDGLSMTMWLPALAELTPEQIDAQLQPGTALRVLLDELNVQNNTLLLASLPAQYRVVASTQRADRWRDLRQLEMRSISEKSVDAQFWAPACRSIMPVAIQDLSLALQQGQVEACSNTLLELTDYGIANQVHYITEYRCSVYFDSIFIDLNSYQDLSDQQQEWVRGASEYAAQKLQELMPERMAEIEQTLREEGVTFSIVEEEARSQLLETGRPVLLERYESLLGSSNVEQLLAAAQEGLE